MATSTKALNSKSQHFQSQYRTISQFRRNTFQMIELFSVRFAVFVFALLLITSPRVAAENREGAFTLSPFLGAQGFPFGGQTHYDADFDWGIKAGYNITPHWGTEFVFGLNKTVHDPEAEYCNVYQYGADALYYFRPEKKIVPYLAAGFGVLDVKYYGAFDGIPPAGSQLNSDETNPYFNIGCGVEFEITSWMGFRVDYRDAIMLNSGDQAMQGVVGLRFQF